MTADSGYGMKEFGKKIELFSDNYIAEKIDGLAFRYYRPECLCKALDFSFPWENAGSLCLTVFEDGETVKMYTRGYPESLTDDESVSCLYESRDGLSFSPVTVSEIPYHGIEVNNIVKMGMTCHNFAVFLDSNPSCSPDERYKAVGGTFRTDGLFAYSSPDGIHWRNMAENQVLTDGSFDSMNMAFWDPAAGVYRCYYRYYEKDIRAIASSTSDDFVNWSAPVPNRYAGGIREHLYTNAVRPVPGAEHMLISFPMRYCPERKIGLTDSFAASRPGVSDCILMTSRNGNDWSRPCDGPWISGGLDKREWTQRNFITAGGIVCRGDSFYIYVEKHYMWDDCGIWVYSVPRYRFSSLGAGEKQGSFVSGLMRFETPSFFVNFRTSALGYVRFRILDEDGHDMASSEDLWGNEISKEVILPQIEGRTGYIRAEMSEAELYAIGSRML
ncbi:MAG: hypothetical protein J5933_00345 [Clostridia bacterium]|nr:hypothetical protein [Clostridia bacterium]